MIMEKIIIPVLYIMKLIIVSNAQIKSFAMNVKLVITNIMKINYVQRKVI